MSEPACGYELDDIVTTEQAIHEVRSVLLTGAAGGIGSCVARALLKTGMNVLASDIDGDKLASEAI